MMGLHLLRRNAPSKILAHLRPGVTYSGEYRSIDNFDSPHRVLDRVNQRCDHLVNGGQSESQRALAFRWNPFRQPVKRS